MSGPVPRWARRTGDAWRLTVRVQPGAGRSQVAGPIGDALKVRVAAPANEGKANAELVRFLARQLGVARGAVRIVTGETNRTKVVEVAAAIDLDVLEVEP